MGNAPSPSEQGCVRHGTPGSDSLEVETGSRRPPREGRGGREQRPGCWPAPVCACNVSAQQGTAQQVGVTPRKASSREEGQREVTTGEVGARAGQTVVTVVTEEAAEAK